MGVNRLNAVQKATYFLKKIKRGKNEECTVTVKTHWIHKIGNRQPLTWTTFRVERNQFLQLRVLGRILSGSWVGSYQDLG